MTKNTSNNDTPNWSRLDGRMAAFISDWLDSAQESRDNSAVSTWVETKGTLTTKRQKELKNLGVHVTRPNLVVHTGNISPENIISLSHKKYIVRLTKSEKLNLV